MSRRSRRTRRQARAKAIEKSARAAVRRFVALRERARRLERGEPVFHRVMSTLRVFDDIRAAETFGRAIAGLPPWPREVL